jgi:geranylgeranyl reductase family protein
MRTSVVVVGAGPGGAAAAVALAQRGVRDVVLLDKDTFPREKTCGSALSPNGLKLIESLGIGDEVRRLGYGIRALTLKTPGQRVMQLADEQAAVILLRKYFDNLLVERARALGVEFRSGFQAKALITEGGRVVGVRGPAGEVRADYVLCADGAHSIFSHDPRPKRTISTLMGWWENFPFEPHTIEMIFDKNVAPLYGWMFPETTERVNIGICIDGEDKNGAKTSRNVRHVFQQFLDDHFAEKLKSARQVGKWKGHPISYTTWVGHCTSPGALFLGEAARMTHNATGEGIYQAMQSGVYAADAVADVLAGRQSEARAWAAYARECRRKFTASFVVGHVVRAMVQTPALDGIAMLYNNPRVRDLVSRTIGVALSGSKARGADPTDAAAAAANPLEGARQPSRSAAATA